MGPAIELRGVSKKYRLYHERPASLKERVVRKQRAHYDELWAVKDIDLEVGRGEAVGLIGHNGSGKSTMLRLIARIHQPTQGTVRTSGRIGALLELGAGFHPELTGRENVYLNGAIMGLGKKQIRIAFDDIVAFSGLEQFIDNPVKVYSSGMYMRLAFSVAVSLDPEILLVDEIIAVGDEEFQRKCMDHIEKLQRNGCTIVFVSHALPTVERLCDRAVLLDHGRAAYAGSASQVVAEYTKRVDSGEIHLQ